MTQKQLAEAACRVENKYTFRTSGSSVFTSTNDNAHSAYPDCFAMKLKDVISRLQLFLLLHIFHITDAKTAELLKRTEPCQGVEVVTREEWRARPTWRHIRMKTPVNDVIIQHTVTSECFTKQQCARDMQFIQDFHMDDRAWGDIAYNFMIGGDGRAYEGNGWTEPGAHSINFNRNSIGIAFVGDYSDVEPSQKMIDAALNLIECGAQKGYLTPTREIHGHRDVACTKSPGDKLYAIIRKWKNYKGGRMPLYNCS